MAKTGFMEKEIEPFVCNWLSQQFHGKSFEKKPVKLVSGASYSFDAVSQDNSIVAAILSNRAKTRTGRENTGGVRKALMELCYLKAVPASYQKLMVFTDDDFRQLMGRRACRLGKEEVQMMLCPLTPNLRRQLTATLDEASREQRAAE